MGRGDGAVQGVLWLLKVQILHTHRNGAMQEWCIERRTAMQHHELWLERQS
jgi:hypothetical protein